MHRMRHTMATKLAKGGASCSTIMGVVGWSSYSAMVGYVGIDEEDKERGYTEAMERADEKDAHQPESQVLTLAEVFERTRKCEIAGLVSFLWQRGVKANFHATLQIPL